MDVAYEIAKKKFIQDKDNKRIDYNSISSAIQLIVENEVLDMNHLTDDDLRYLNIIIKKLNQRNSSVESKNKNKDKETPIHLYLSIPPLEIRKISNLIYRGILHNMSRTRRSKSITLDGDAVGKILLVDLSVAYYNRIFNVQNAVKYFQKDLRDNAKKGFEYYSKVEL